MQHTNVNDLPSYKLKFSICTLVTDLVEYEEMKNSFLQHGFNDCEFLIADNSKGNTFDAYQAIRKFFNTAQGQYLIICHQDILIRSSVSQLEKCLTELNNKHPLWAIAGNAGGKHIKGVVKHLINHDNSTSTYTPLPVRVYSVDENFIVIDKQKFSSVSKDLNGFHFYGTDMCMLADIQGYESYVIDFMLHHKSAGNFNADFYTQKNKFQAKYTKALRGRFIESTCARLFLSGNKLKNYFFNSTFVFFCVKTYYKFKN